jgi:hypothetical protein
MVVLGWTLVVRRGSAGELLPTWVNRVYDAVGTFMLCMGVGTWLIATYAALKTIGDDFWRGFGLGAYSILLLVGATWYVRAALAGVAAENELSESMRQMMNAVPKSQRYGYAEDFPTGTRFRP